MEDLLIFLKNVTDYLNYVIFGIPLYKLVLALVVVFLPLFLRKFFIFGNSKICRTLSKKDFH